MVPLVLPTEYSYSAQRLCYVHSAAQDLAELGMMVQALGSMHSQRKARIANCTSDLSSLITGALQAASQLLGS